MAHAHMNLKRMVMMMYQLIIIIYNEYNYPMSANHNQSLVNFHTCKMRKMKTASWNLT